MIQGMEEKLEYVTRKIILNASTKQVLKNGEN
jgi:hypothetical protein